MTDDKVKVLEEDAKRSERMSFESWERSDTDGHLSQWAYDIDARLQRERVKIERAGGLAEFPALFDLDGNRVEAKLVSGRYGPCWLIKTGPEYGDVRFVSAFPKRSSTLEKKGFVEGVERAPARAILAGGPGGAVSVGVRVIRDDGGYPGAGRRG